MRPLTSLAFARGWMLMWAGIWWHGLLFFAFTTIPGWNYYGERCTEYLFGG